MKLKTTQIFFRTTVHASAITAMLFLCGCKEKEIRSAPMEIQLYPDFLENTSWLIDNERLIGLKSGDSVFQMTLKPDSIQPLNVSILKFDRDGKFKNFDTWQCGTDCFTAIYGKYEFTAARKIRLITDSIQRRGTCDAATEVFRGDVTAECHVNRNGNRLSLTRTD